MNTIKPKRGRRNPARRQRALLARAASTPIKPFTFIQPGMQVVLRLRVSTAGQKSHLDDHETYLRAQVTTVGGKVVAVDKRIGSGVDLSSLRSSVALAKHHDAVLLAVTPNRFVRQPGFGARTCQHVQADEDTLAGLMHIADGVTLVTHLEPRASAKEENRHLSQIGQAAKGGSGGRPRKSKPGSKKRERLEAEPKVRWMRLAGMGNRQIARVLGKPESTVRRWGAPFSPIAEGHQHN
ncbi:helix-turn-helix domain-containing protein [Roseimaritima multifibrata]|nr:helix-turn-helix domain-containing protein [Roseimaritima multifibrata]